MDIENPHRPGEDRHSELKHAAPVTDIARSGIPALVHPGMGFKEFVIIMAALMAMNALAIDSMLPALPQIGHSLGIEVFNQRQWIITAYLLGFGGAQIIYGTLSDRFGRKPVLLAGICIYALASLLASQAGSFEFMIAARVAQGIGAASTRVLAVSIIRDCYSGRVMARIMSLAFIVFLAAPIIAPSIGQGILLLAPWPWIFSVLAAFGILMLCWTGFRLPETLHAEDRMPIQFGRVTNAFRLALTTRISVLYMLAMTLIMGALFGFINSVQQVFADVFALPQWFTTVFALVAIFMGLAALLNSRIVVRMGTRRVSHAALVGFIVFSVVHCAVAVAGLESIWTFAVLQALTMFCFGLVTSNFNAIAMEPLGHIAGTASSVQGFVTTVGGALIGLFVGQHFDGTVVPLTLGYAICGMLAIVLIAIAEHGRMFRSGANAG